MRLRIKANNFLEMCYLQVDDRGATYCRTMFLGGKRHFGFDQIDAILLSPENVLSVQVGREVFRLRTIPRKRAHQATIRALVEGVRRTQAGPAPARNG